MLLAWHYSQQMLPRGPLPPSLNPSLLPPPLVPPVPQLSLVCSIKESCVCRDLLGALMALAAGPISRANKMNDDDHQVCVGGGGE